MVTIRKYIAANGAYYEIEDFESYIKILREKGVEAPRAKYRVFISKADELAISRSVADWEAQIALFFELGPALGIEYRIIEGENIPAEKN
jgi:hypothetical protein